MALQKKKMEQTNPKRQSFQLIKKLKEVQFKKTNIPEPQTSKNVVIVVAHPDDETLWAGGFIMDHAAWNFFIICLCRESDPDRAPKFRMVLNILNAGGTMDNLDDDPEQRPLEDQKLEDQIIRHFPLYPIDLVITHSPFGEYTRHRRHEEIGKTVISLWKNKKIDTGELWLFAYEDGEGNYFPAPIKKATGQFQLAPEIARIKYQIITEIYGFEPNSWEAQICPKKEAFWQFSKALEAYQWQNKKKSW